MMRFITRASVLTGVVLMAGDGVDSAAPVTPAADAAIHRVVRHVTIPAGTILRLRVNRAFGSDISRVEDPVPATLAGPVVIGGRTVLPAGSHVSGYVTQATRPGRVRGRGRVGVRFTRITPAGDDASFSMQTRSWVAVAPGTKKRDAMTIGLPAAGGAVVGGLIDGKKGAGVGALVGGGAGTAAVLSTRGKDVRIGRGATLSVRLTAPLTVAVDDQR
jgi:hypothetical protein